MATIKAEPKKMDEIDYYLNELNSTDDERVNVTKAQIKGAYNSLKDLVNELRVEIKFLIEDLSYHIIDYDNYVSDDLKEIISKKYELQAKYFVLKQKVDNNGK